jgi:hypothetical protein
MRYMHIIYILICAYKLDINVKEKKIIMSVSINTLKFIIKHLKNKIYFTYLTIKSQLGKLYNINFLYGIK